MAERFIDVIHAHEESVKTLGYSPCGRFLISGGGDGKTRIWDTHRTRLVYENAGRSSVTCTRFSPDGKMWATIDREGDIRLHQTSDNEQVMSVKFAPNAGFEFTPDSRHLLGANAQGRVFLYGIQNRTPLYVHKHNEYDVHALAVSPDGRYLASGGSDCVIRLYDMQEGKEKPYLDFHKNTVTSITFAPDSKTMGSSDAGAMMAYWDASQSGTANSLKQHFSWATQQVNVVRFSPDNLIFATGSHDSRLRLFSVAETNKRLEDLAGHQRHIYDLCFSPDGKFVATASGDGTIRIWSVKKPYQVS